MFITCLIAKARFLAPTLEGLELAHVVPEGQFDHGCRDADDNPADLGEYLVGREAEPVCIGMILAQPQLLEEMMVVNIQRGEPFLDDGPQTIQNRPSLIFAYRFSTKLFTADLVEKLCANPLNNRWHIHQHRRAFCPSGNLNEMRNS
jgi:hypothetical protein